MARSALLSLLLSALVLATVSGRGDHSHVAAEPVPGRAAALETKLAALERSSPVEASAANKPFVYPFVHPFWDKESVEKTTDSIKELWSKPGSFYAAFPFMFWCARAQPAL